jgi:hypothetical protein
VFDSKLLGGNIMTGKYAEIRDENEYAKALKLAKGCFQRDLLAGYEALSLATLRGKAAKYTSSYAQSRDNLLSRLRKSNVVFCEVRGKNNKRILVIG